MSRQGITTYSNLEKQWKLLVPVKTQPRTYKIKIFTTEDVENKSYSLPNIDKANVVALDFETRGTNWMLPNTDVVGVGIAYEEGSFYFPLHSASEESRKALLSYLSTLPLIGHNVAFDGGWLYSITGKWPWVACTYGVYKHLASEGFPNQSWGLKNAQKDMLGWQHTNEKKLDLWLIENGYISDTKKDKASDKHHYDMKTNRWYKPQKGFMYKAPDDILGHYCCLDADSTYMLYTKVLEPAMNRIPPQYKNEYLPAFMSHVKRLVKAQKYGIEFDEQKAVKHLTHLKNQMQETHKRFFSHPEVAEALRIFKENKINQHFEKRPEQYKKKPKAPKEPARYKKNGEISAAWLKWQERFIEWENTPLQVSKNYITWEEKLEEIKKGEREAFNLRSNDQLSWLFYDNILKGKLTEVEAYRDKIRRGSFKFDVDGKEVELDYTEGGKYPTGTEALQYLGEPGKILAEYSKLSKEEGYVKAALEHQYKGRIHATYRVPGTLTGRLAGSGGINMQQLPKSRGYLECYYPGASGADTDYEWVDFDFTAVEPTVLADISKDKALMDVYGNKDKPNDIYLYFGSNIPGMGKEILDAGYDPENPTKEAISLVKKKFKRYRSIFKTVYLAKQYGAGAKKIYKTLKLSGENLDFKQVDKISRAYNTTFVGVKTFERNLIEEYETNGGWVLNGVGRPIAIDDRLKKDIVNRWVQSTAHDLLIYWLDFLDALNEKAGIRVEYVIPDFHDQAIWSVHKKDKRVLLDNIMQACYDMNRWLKGAIEITGEPMEIETLANAKLEG